MDPSRRELWCGLGFGLGALVAWWWRGAAGGGLPTAAAGPLRPPGAGGERQFLAACIRCGLCVQACPYDTLRSDGPAAAGPRAHGAPSVDARANPCWRCKDQPELLCIAACPTGALQPMPVADLRIGLAAIDRTTCLAFNGVTCRACWHACPFPDRALRYDDRLRPLVDAEACIGCGLCEHACLVEPAAIVVRPHAEGA
ncbi:MAG: 4Fe-4S binding protein [Planctomycetota bacterium]